MPHLPTVNALLNGIAALLLVTGYLLIRRGKREAHRRVMLAAFAVAVLFIISYLIYHFQAGSVRFQRQGTIRTTYLTILMTHTILAAIVPLLAIITLVRAWRGRYALHRKIARVTLPLWLYVSVSGVAVYWMLYRM